jgi:hypothetical protein
LFQEVCIVIDKIGGVPEQISGIQGGRKHAKSKKEAAPAEPRDKVSLGTTPAEKKKWTVLFYFDGNNNLASMAGHSFNSLQKVGSDENVNLVGLYAQTGNTAQRGLIQKKEDLPGELKNSKLLFPNGEDVGEKDMGDPATLKEFLEWGVKKYPAEHYAVVTWNHGAGFMGSMTDDKSKHIIDNREMAGVLNSVKEKIGKPVDVMDFNACLMGMAEVGYELKDGARYLVGSEEVEAGLRIPIPGLYGTTPQHKVMEDLKTGIKARGDVSPEELSKLYVFESEKQFGATMFTPTQSAVDLSKMDTVKNAADGLAGKLLEALEKDPKKLVDLRKDIGKTQNYLKCDMFAEPYIDHRDLGHFAKVIAEADHYGPEIKKAAQELREAVKGAVIAEEHTAESSQGNLMEHSTGMAVYLPKDYGYDLPRKNPIDNVPSGGTHGYEESSFAKDTRWDEMLKAVSLDKDWLGKHPKVRDVAEKLLPLVQYEGYQQAYNVVSGATKASWSLYPIGGMLPIPVPGPVAAVGGIAGGAIRTFKGVKKAAAGIVEKFRPKIKAKLAANGIVDTAIGAGSIVLCGSLLAGATAVAVPAALVVLGLGAGRAVVNLATGIAKTVKAGKMNVDQKLAAVDKEMKEKKAFS